MTNYYLALTLGAVDYGPDQVVEGTSSDSSADFEVRISGTNSPTRKEIILFLQAIERYLIDGRYTSLPFTP